MKFGLPSNRLQIQIHTHTRAHTHTHTHTAFAEAVNKDKFPLLFGWIERMKEDDAVKQSYLPTENHLAFYKSFQNGGSHDYGTADLTGKGVNIYTKPK